MSTACVGNGSLPWGAYLPLVIGYQLSCRSFPWQAQTPAQARLAYSKMASCSPRVRGNTRNVECASHAWPCFLQDCVFPTGALKRQECGVRKPCLRRVSHGCAETPLSPKYLIVATGILPTHHLIASTLTFLILHINS
jgi:hypothetical protein